MCNFFLGEEDNLVKIKQQANRENILKQRYSIEK
jgi:hypothetical protein